MQTCEGHSYLLNLGFSRWWWKVSRGCGWFFSLNCYISRKLEWEKRVHATITVHKHCYEKNSSKKFTEKESSLEIEEKRREKEPKKKHKPNGNSLLLENNSINLKLVNFYNLNFKGKIRSSKHSIVFCNLPLIRSSKNRHVINKNITLVWKIHIITLTITRKI